MRQYPKSSYFPNDDSVSHLKYIQQDRDVKLNDSSPSRSQYISFPFSRTSLWDRRTMSDSFVVNPEDIISPLFLGTSVIKCIVKDLINVAKQPHRQFLQYNAQLSNVMDLLEDDLNFIRILPGKTSNQIIKIFQLNSINTRLSREGIMDDKSCLKIPIHLVHSNEELISLDTNETIYLLENLYKALIQSNEFVLKSVIRVRGYGTIKDLHSSCSYSIAAVRFEVILFDNSFFMQPIHPLPLLSTTLSEHLQETLQLSTSTHLRSPRMGYVTLNQTRKVALLLDTDPAVRVTPIVGLWVTLPSSNSSNSSPTVTVAVTMAPKEILQDPFLWAACVRFFQRVVNVPEDEADGRESPDFVCIDPDKKTFLLVVLTAQSSPLFIEVSPHYSNSDNSNSHSNTYTTSASDAAGLPGLSSSLSPVGFKCLDFTADLVTPNTEGELGQPLLCRFRSLSQPALISSFHTAVRSTDMYRCYLSQFPSNTTNTTDPDEHTGTHKIYASPDPRDRTTRHSNNSNNNHNNNNNNKDSRSSPYSPLSESQFSPVLQNLSPQDAYLRGSLNPTALWREGDEAPDRSSSQVFSQLQRSFSDDMDNEAITPIPRSPDHLPTPTQLLLSPNLMSSGPSQRDALVRESSAVAAAGTDFHRTNCLSDQLMVQSSHALIASGSYKQHNATSSGHGTASPVEECTGCPRCKELESECMRLREVEIALRSEINRLQSHLSSLVVKPESPLEAAGTHLLDSETYISNPASIQTEEVEETSHPMKVEIAKVIERTENGYHSESRSNPTSHISKELKEDVSHTSSPEEEEDGDSCEDPIFRPMRMPTIIQFSEALSSSAPLSPIYTGSMDSSSIQQEISGWKFSMNTVFAEESESILAIEAKYLRNKPP